jgi:hypothetical protein
MPTPDKMILSLGFKLCWRLELALTTMTDGKRLGLMRQSNHARCYQRSEPAGALDSCQETFVATAAMCGMGDILLFINARLLPAGVNAIVLKNTLETIS